MATKTRTTVRYRRKRSGRTNYRKRLELLKGRTNRLVIRRTNTEIILQIVKYEPDGDKVLLTSRSNELKKKGWKYSCKNIPACYLAGMLLAQKAKEKKLTEAVMDIGLQRPLKGSKIYAALQGAIDGGMKIPAGKEIAPTEERLTGKHIAAYLDKFKDITTDFNKIKESFK